MLETLRANEKGMAVEFSLDVSSLFQALQVCESYLIANGVVDSSRFHNTFLELFKEAVLSGLGRGHQGRAVVCMERLTSDFLRITIQSGGNSDSGQHADVRVSHACLSGGGNGAGAVTSKETPVCHLQILAEKMVSFLQKESRYA